MRIIIINGPNLNLVGKREPDIYGTGDINEYLKKLQEKYAQIQIEYFQSNVEGELINKLQEVGFNFDGIILNAGGYTHTSVAIGDAIAAIKTPVIEVHISNVFAREEYQSAGYCSGGGIVLPSGVLTTPLGAVWHVHEPEQGRRVVRFNHSAQTFRDRLSRTDRASGHARFYQTDTQSKRAID